MAQDRKGPVTQLREQLAEKSKSCKDLQEEYLRALADFENFRKRNQRDSELSRRMALEALVLDLVPVLDNFERAVQAASGATASVDSVKKGMELIRRQLGEALCKHGVEEYSCMGTQFDPRRAEAISFVHTDEHKPGTVVSEVCKGYACGERVLRAAKVVVAKEPERRQKPEDESSKATDAGKAGAKSEDSGAEPKEIGESAGESKD